MFLTEEKIRKSIVARDGENEYQIRYFRDEDAGVLTTRSGKSYFILDSGDYWYDLIQEKYPAKQKCGCKNDYFKLCFDYVPRRETDDYRAIELISCCTQCGKQRKFGEIDIDYSPTSQLFEQPITGCENPKIKYKTYAMKGYWKEEAFCQLIEFLLQKQMLIYCWFWNQTEKKRYVERLTDEQLRDFLFVEKSQYLHVYFSLEPLEELFAQSPLDSKGICVDRNIWRKNEIVRLNHPILVAVRGGGYFYSMDFCSEFINEAGEIKEKSDYFCKLAKELLAYFKETFGK